MPELPEVESLRRSLIPFVVGQNINKVDVRLAKLVSGKGTKRQASSSVQKEFENGLVAKTIVGIDRRNKNLIFNLEDKNAKHSLFMVHLKMTGQLVYQASNKQDLVIGGHPIEDSQYTLPHKHTYVTFELDKGNLYYNDTRQFGYLLYFDSLAKFESENHFQDFGPEPLDNEFEFEKFYKTLKTKNGVIKKVLMDGNLVVGIGNIYADEICFASKVLPTRIAKSLTKNEVQKLFNNIKLILNLAIENGGSSLANYLLADGSRGNYARLHKVYGRGGKPCYTCKSTLKKTIIAGRGTVYCQKCQK